MKEHCVRNWVRARHIPAQDVTEGVVFLFDGDGAAVGDFGVGNDRDSAVA